MANVIDGSTSKNFLVHFHTEYLNNRVFQFTDYILENQNDLPINRNTESSGNSDLVLGKDDANPINVRTQAMLSNENNDSTDTVTIPSTILQKNDDSDSERENIDPFANSDDSDIDQTYIAPSVKVLWN